ncbi:MAG: alpha/beta fold hydrolase [Candidatus Sifarchaeia archaeon]
MPFIEHQGTRIHYLELDERLDKSRGLTVVFVHGAGSSHETWALQTDEFKRTHRVIAPDLSGHGRSDSGPDNISIEEGFTMEVATLVNHLDLDDFVLVGHSMGGGVVMAYALNNDLRRPAAIALVDTSPCLELGKLARGLAKETIETQLYLLKGRKKASFQEAYDIVRREEDTKRRNPRVMTRDLAAADKFDVSDRIENINVPTFVLVGERDDIISPNVAKQFEAALPRADIAVIKDAHHAAMLHNPEMFNQLLTKYLDWVESTIVSSSA